MRILLGLVAAVVWANPANATNWYLVATAKSGASASFVDRDSITDMGASMRRAKTYQVFAVNTSDGSAAYQPYLEFDCVGARYRFISIKSVDSSGGVFKDDVGSGKWRMIDPGSIDEMQQTFVCSNGARPGDAVSYGSGIPLAAGRAKLRPDKPNVYGGH